MKVEEHKQKTVSALKWNMLNQVITQIVTFGIGILLMRLLKPTEFGLLGMVAVFSGFMNVFNNFGLGTALIQKKEIDEKDKSTIFYVNVAIGIFLTLILFFGSNFIASFYNTPKLERIAKYISVIFTIQALGMIHLTLLRKELDYKKIFIIKTITVIIGGSFALYFALNNYGVWTLVYQQIITGLLGTILVWLLVSWRPRFVFSIEHLKGHLKFSLPLLGTNTFNYWTRNADNLLIGKFLGSQSLGLYSRAYNLMMLPITQVSRVISTVMMPSLSLIQDDKKRIKTIYLKISRVIAFVTFPMMGILFATAKPLVTFAFGENWMGIVFLLKVFSFIGALQSIITLSGNIFISQGKTKLQFQLKIFTSIVVITAFLISVQFGINAVAIAYLGSFLINLFPNLFFMGKLIDLNINDIFKNLKPHIVLTIVLTIFAMFLIKYLSDSSDLIQIFFCSSLFSLGWVLYFKWFNKKIYNEILILLREIKSDKKVG